MMLNLRTWSAASLAAAAFLLIAGSAQAAVPVLYSGTIDFFSGPGNQIPGGNPVLGPTTAAPGFLFVETSGTMAGGFTVPAGDFGITTTFMATGLPFPLVFSTTTATWANDAGNFFPGGAPGPVTYCPGGCATPTRPGMVTMTPGAGPNFGGTMGLLGQTVAKLGIASGGGTLAGSFVFPLNFAGVAVGNKTTTTAIFSHNTLGFTVPLQGVLTGFPWTLGTIVLAQPLGISATTLTTSGTDLRNTAGTSGQIQLVSGWIGHLAGLVTDENVGRAQTNLTLVPEPGMLMQLGAGMTMICGVARLRKRRA